MTLWVLLALPALLAVACALVPSPRAVLAVVALGGIAVAGWSGFAVLAAFDAPLVAWDGNLRMDALSAFHLAIVAIVFALASLYARVYFAPAVASGHFGSAMARRFGAAWFAFLASMILVLVSGNIGLLWVAMETTTLASALLVCLEFDAASVRAAWTYLMICSVGIAMALLGTFLLAGEARTVLGAGASPFLWTDLLDVADRMRPGAVRLAFVFLLVGYGTKAGLAPMHAWLPDAHGQAPAPVSAVLSGVLLNCALYAISRFLPIVNAATGGDGWTLLVPFGLLSLGVAAIHLLRERDMKRLLAYCSVEHIGIIALAIGLGAPAAALFHTLNHSLAKTVAFFAAGIVARDRGTRDTGRIGGLARIHPLAGAALLLALLALVAMPPSATFQSELWLARAGMAGGHWPAVVAFLLAVAVAFVGLLRPFLGMAWRAAPKDVATVGAPRLLWPLTVLPLAALAILGLWMPAGLATALSQAAAILGVRP